MIKLNKLVGVYKITNKENEKVYIGKSNDIDGRWKTHIRFLDANNHYNYKLQEDWNRYGEDCFTFEILEDITEEVDLGLRSDTELIQIENAYMISYDAINTGYNIEKTLDKILKAEHDKIPTLKNSFIKLPNDIYDDVNITNEEITILILLLRNYNERRSVAMCSVQMICDYMRIDVSNNRNLVTVIKESLTKLKDKGYIIKIYNLCDEDCDENNVEFTFKLIIKNKNTLFFVELLEIPTTSYFKVYNRDVNLIFKHFQHNNLNKFNLIRYFIACCRVSSNSKNFGYLTQNQLNGLVTDSRTIQKYNNILQDDLNLIVYNNDYLTLEYKYCTTYIGKYYAKDNFNRQLKLEVIKKGLTHTNKSTSNLRRSLMQQINNAHGEELIELEKQYKELEYKSKEVSQ